MERVWAVRVVEFDPLTDDTFGHEAIGQLMQIDGFVMKELAGHKHITATQRYVEIGEHQLRAALE